jgi:hypothetical protein
MRFTREDRIAILSAAMSMPYHFARMLHDRALELVRVIWRFCRARTRGPLLFVARQARQRRGAILRALPSVVAIGLCIAFELFRGHGHYLSDMACVLGAVTILAIAR